MARIALINGHPDPAPNHYCAALAAAYAEGAEAGGHAVEPITIGAVPLEFLSTQAEFDAPPGEPIRALQETVQAAQHLVLVYPLWLGTMPARLKAFLEHLGRGHFFIGPTDGPGWPKKKMSGRSARIIVTMGMPGFAYRLFFGAHSVKALEAGILRLSGFKPVRHTIIGSVNDEHQRARMLEKARTLGRAGV